MDIFPDRMVVLDFSGTLSLASARFGREEVLLQMLKESGLWALGVDSAQCFWTEIVNPTWEAGSTTGQGYQHLISERLRQLSAEWNSPLQEAQLHAGAEAFVAAYFNHSTLSPEWQPLLQQMASHFEALAVIATDHYAEATEHIGDQLRRWGIESAPALRPRRPGQILIANSADLGYPKSRREFWEKLKRAQEIERLSVIGIVDDFGFNEQLEDAYTAPEQIAMRREQTVALMADVFLAQVRVFPFFLESDAAHIASAEEDRQIKAYLALMDQAVGFVRKILSTRP